MVRVRVLKCIRTFLVLFLFMIFLVPSFNCSHSRRKKSFTYYGLGNQAFQDGNLVQAYDYFQQAHDISPRDPDYEHMLGLVHFVRGDFDYKHEYLNRAEKHLLNAIINYDGFEPTEEQDFGRLSISEARINLSAVYLNAGRWDEAIAQAQKAIEDPLYRSPDNANYNIGVAYFRKDLPLKAIPYLQMSVKQNRDFAGGYKTLGEVYLDLKKYPEAIRYFERAIKAYDQYTEAYYLMGLAYQKQNRRTIARKWFKKCKRLDKIDKEDPFQEKCADFLH